MTSVYTCTCIIITLERSFSGLVITSPSTGVLTSAKIKKLSFAMIDGLCKKGKRQGGTESVILNSIATS